MKAVVQKQDSEEKKGLTLGKTRETLKKMIPFLGIIIMILVFQIAGNGKLIIPWRRSRQFC